MIRPIDNNYTQSAQVKVGVLILKEETVLFTGYDFSTLTGQKVSKDPTLRQFGNKMGYNLTYLTMQDKRLIPVILIYTQT